MLWEAWDSDPRAILSELIGTADILFGNHRDLSLVLGKEFSGEGEDRRREAAEAGFAAFPDLKLIASTARHTVTADHHRIPARADQIGRASCRESVSVRVGHGGRRLLKKKKKNLTKLEVVIESITTYS